MKECNCEMCAILLARKSQYGTKGLALQCITSNNTQKKTEKKKEQGVLICWKLVQLATRRGTKKWPDLKTPIVSAFPVNIISVNFNLSILISIYCLYYLFSSL